MNNIFLIRIMRIYLVLLSAAIFLQVAHYVLYYNQDFSLSLVWSLVDWNIWFLIFLALFYFKYQNHSSNEKSDRGYIFLILICLFFPVLHTVLSKIFFLTIFEPSRPFFEDVIRQFSKKWFQNIFIAIGLYFLFDHLFQPYILVKKNDNHIDYTSAYRLLVTDGKSKYQLLPTKIEWIESVKNYVVINTVSGKQIVVRKTISSIHDTLKDFEFIRISRSTIINKNYIHAIKKRTKYSYSIVTKSNENFPIGKTYLKKTLLLFKS